MASDSYLMAQDADPQYSEHGIGDLALGHAIHPRHEIGIESTHTVDTDTQKMQRRQPKRPMSIATSRISVVRKCVDGSKASINVAPVAASNRIAPQRSGQPPIVSA